MSKTSSWILSIFIALVILGFIAYGRSTRQSYWVARRALNRPAIVILAPSEQVLQWRLHYWFER
jgi:hypothetical protein